MKKTVLLSLILVYAIISRFWQIGKIPPLIDSTILSARLLSVFFNISSIIVLYSYSKNLFGKPKIALITAWVFLLLPWSIEQGRIASQVNNSLFILLTFLILINKFNKAYLKILFFVLCSLFFVFFYPQLWLFQKVKLFLPVSDLINNIFILTSFDFLFFKNITFWWGGVREMGILYLAFLPFLLLGIDQIIAGGKYNIILGIGLILLISATSPFFPESREFFLATPFLSILIAFGIYKLFSQSSIIWSLIHIFLFALIIYDSAQFWHYYAVHYPQQVTSNRANIHEPF